MSASLLLFLICQKPKFLLNCRHPHFSVFSRNTFSLRYSVILPSSFTMVLSLSYNTLIFHLCRFLLRSFYILLSLLFSNITSVFNFFSLSHQITIFIFFLDTASIAFCLSFLIETLGITINLFSLFFSCYSYLHSLFPVLSSYNFFSFSEIGLLLIFQ